MHKLNKLCCLMMDCCQPCTFVYSFNFTEMRCLVAAASCIAAVLTCVLSGTMAVPPAYSDLGKSAKDLFNKGYGK